MILALEITLLVTSVLLIALVLLHKGKGGGLSDLFGGGVSTSLGDRALLNATLDRVTVGVGPSGRPRFWHSDWITRS